MQNPVYSHTIDTFDKTLITLLCRAKRYEPRATVLLVHIRIQLFNTCNRSAVEKGNELQFYYIAG